MATTSKPMPTTGMPDRVGTEPPTDWDNRMREGMKSSNEMKINPGRAPDEPDKYPVKR